MFRLLEIQQSLRRQFLKWDEQFFRCALGLGATTKFKEFPDQPENVFGLSPPSVTQGVQSLVRCERGRRRGRALTEAILKRTHNS